MTVHSIVEIKGLSYRYEKDIVLENINISIPKGSFLAIVGPNGSGKSTLLKLILGLLKPQKGEIKLFGDEMNRFKDWEKIGYVSQKANSFNTGFPASVFEVVSSGLTKKLGMFRFFKKEDKQKVLHALEAVDMEKYKNRNIGELSGGQQQRVFIARALVSEPQLLILDEPTVGIDVQNVNAFYQMLADLNKNRDITLLLVTHDISTISDKVTHVACLNQHLYFHGEPQEFEHLRADGVSDFYGYDVNLLHHHHEHGGVLK
ncbi:metal ABC transporter ATP-binding protein [Neobacillus sp. PS3-40]|jgi:zinc transport system ATP-binding protein|uniref:metal ABC transporter ATP-binding protein n=1 Tax=Neobacillus sp. PS3-40 TaxID=3070679 RepID=UPI0027DEB237|nr:metal ABC transporter ATP-binding protein [Neobacillus sp. PS3-40]WML45328.1 metal ABC transporter ATP-binding protein [Neobacillus sp. PS3-40]